MARFACGCDRVTQPCDHEHGYPVETKDSRLAHGLWLALIVAGLMAALGAIWLACLGVRAVHDWNEPAGVALGLFAVLVFFFILGATADWSDD